jgi:hypothetical protein
MLLRLDCAARAKSKALKLMSCKSFYSDEHLEALRANLQRIEGRTNDLLLKYTAHSFANEKAREFARHGFGRRMQTLRRCIQKVFEVVPPERP